MQEPAYILKNGKPVPYIPVTITTSREAYAASLHVLFKHVADFHICVVRVFSAKYGIPEDDILKTIQESDEFKNMYVDPVLDTDNIDSLGYLAQVPVPEPVTVTEVPVTEVPVTEVPVPAKPTKVKKTTNPEPEPAPIDPIIVAEKSRPVEERESDPSAVKTKTIRKKMVAPIPTPVVVVVADASEPIKTKTIRKKIVPKPTQPITEPIQPVTEPIQPVTEPVKAAPATTITTTASSVPTTVITAASSVPTTVITAAPAEDAPRKIIKKKAKPAA
jgi:hypothetical protein